jgi:hypothetical protein
MCRIDRMREPLPSPLGLNDGIPDGPGQAGYPRPWGSRSQLPVRIALTSSPLVVEHRKRLARVVLLHIEI